MKHIIVALAVSFIAGISLAHDAMPVPVDDAVNNAQIVGIARIAAISVNETRCSISTKIHLSPEKFLMGSLEKKEIIFSYTYYFWKEAFWPWQEDCPSVHYTVPPVAEGMEKGSRVIFTARYFPDWKDHFATATIKMDQLERVKKLMGDKNK